jgi:hypothetical protein
MANRTSKPESFELRLRNQIKRLDDRINRISGFDGTQLTRTVQKLQELVDGLLEQVNGIFSGYVRAGGNITANSGTFISAYARSHSVVTSYVAAYIDGSGNFLSTPSSLRMKRDIATAGWTREQRDAIRVVHYKLRAAYILADMDGRNPEDVETIVGVIGEELVAAGLDDFVVFDDRGRVFTVRYELLALVALDGLQQVERDVDELRDELRTLKETLCI